jgi:hypothetical protein
VVEQGLYCAASALVYPIVSDIPIMLIEEALPASAIAIASCRPRARAHRIAGSRAGFWLYAAHLGGVHDRRLQPLLG